MAGPIFSLIVPTRGRQRQLLRFLESIARTAHRADCLEIVLVLDADDLASRTIEYPPLKLVRAVGEPGRTMGELNSAGFEACLGDYVMLLNDDVIARTRGWDTIARRCFQMFPDPFVLVHVNDTLMRHHLCTFPLVSRAYCELAGGICPRNYQRYRIDDHIEDVFNQLAFLGVRRTVYLPEVVFEHLNAVEHPTAGRIYEADPGVLAHDAPLFEELLPQRKELTMRLLHHIQSESDLPAMRARLETIVDSFALRTEGRQIHVRAAWWKRVQLRYRRDGCVGLARAMGRRLLRRSR